MPDPVRIIGRFPPPLDGQTIATQRVARLLSPSYDVRCINTQPDDETHVAAETRLRPRRVAYYLRSRSHLKEALSSSPEAPVLWASISPMLWGHWRDLIVTLPAISSEHPLCAVVHRGTFDRLFRSRITHRSAVKLVERIDRFVFLNHSLADQCAPWIPESRRSVIPNTIDDELVFTEAEVLSKQNRFEDHGPLRLLFCSNMMAEKGYQDVLQALVLLDQKGVRFKIDFAGRWVADSDRLRFEQDVNRAGLSESVRLHGPVSDRQRMKQLYSEADIFLLPSFHPTEAQPLTVLEAMNAGVPVIVTRHGGLPDIVTDRQEGRLVDTHAPAQITRAIIDMTDRTTWSRYSQNARARFLEYYSPEAVRLQWIALIELLKTGRHDD